MARRLNFARTADDGAVAIEFGLLALPFFAIIAAILETSIVFLASQMLETAVQDASRQIRTGQAQNASFTEADFKTLVCERGFGMFDCDQIKVRVRILETFVATDVLQPIDPDDGSWVVDEQYNPGVGKSIVIAEAYYKWNTHLDVMGFNLTNTSDGKRLLGAVRVWRNEPF